MSQKKKSGLQRGLSDIVAAQTAPVEDKSRLSRGLIDRFTEPKTTSGTVPTTHHDSPPVTTTPRPAPPPSAAPARDFNRRANSLERDAMPGGLFPGSSKKIYDALYLRSRGANPPRARARAARRDFLDWTDIRNLKTVDGHLRYLMSKGLIVRHWELGSTEGSEYEVRLPEELPGLTTTPHQSPPDTATHFSGSGNSQFSGSGGQSQVTDIKEAYGGDKTFKTNTERSDDDEAFAAFAHAMQEAVRDVTGKAAVPAEAERWKEVADVLATELRIAAARTTVSSVPSFLAEHLRRRLFKKDRRQLAAEESAAPPRAPLPEGVDVKTCPDCHGAGFWYPQGFEKGVARCAHEKLLKAES
jgi:hypothetical protein